MPVETSPPGDYKRTCLKWDGGWLEFDAVLRQQIEHDGEVTEHPIDQGADVVDHYRRFNIPLILEAQITNTPLRQPLTHTGGAVAVQRTRDIEIPAPAAFGPFTAPETVFGFDARARHTVTISTLDFSAELDRINAVYTELTAMQLEPRLLSVSLGNLYQAAEGQTVDFDNMLLKSFTVDRETNGVLPLVLEFRQVAFVELTTAQIEVKRPKKSRSTEKKDGGKQSAGDVSGSESAAHLFNRWLNS